MMMGLAKSTVLAALGAVASMTPAPRQAPAQFEVASVKTNTSADVKVVIQMLPGCENGGRPAHRSACDLRALPGTIAAGSATLAEPGNALPPLVGRLVHDRTGRTGRFAFTLRWAPE